MNNYIGEGFYNEEASKFPNILNVEVYRGQCPCACVHCPVGEVEVTKRKEKFGLGSIKMELFKKIVDEAAKYENRTIRLHSVGEPLLWENIEEAVNYTKEKDVVTWLFTSLVTDNMNLIKTLCECVNIIEISINSTDSLDYKATKGINAFEQVSENIKFMREYIDKKNLKTKLVVSRVQSISEVNDKKFIDHWNGSGFVDDAFVRKYHTYNSLMDNIFNNKKDKNGCLVHWMRFNISIEGLVVVCFNTLFKKNLFEELILGDVNSQSIAEIWQGVNYHKLRMADMNNDYDKYGFSKEFPCRECTSCQSYSKEAITSEYQIRKIIGSEYIL